MKRKYTPSQGCHETRVHEAAHLLLSLILDIPVKKVRVKHDPAKNSDGYIQINKMQTVTDEILENLVMIYLAATSAEVSIVRPKTRWGVNGDVKIALELLIDIYCESDLYLSMDSRAQTTFLRKELLRRKLLLDSLFQRPFIKNWVLELSDIMRTNNNIIGPARVRQLQRSIIYDKSRRWRAIKSLIIRARFSR